jgi:hypothetical protein
VPEVHLTHLSVRLTPLTLGQSAVFLEPFTKFPPVKLAATKQPSPGWEFESAISLTLADNLTARKGQPAADTAAEFLQPKWPLPQGDRRLISKFTPQLKLLEAGKFSRLLGALANRVAHPTLRVEISLLHNAFLVQVFSQNKLRFFEKPGKSPPDTEISWPIGFRSGVFRSGWLGRHLFPADFFVCHLQRPLTGREKHSSQLG